MTDLIGVVEDEVVEVGDLEGHGVIRVMIAVKEVSY